jgi:GR25 family glycosyltransferase involved in LPS biosynthesis
MFDNFGPVYVVNLKRREDRKNILEGLFKEKSITDYTFIEAIDARDDLCDLVEHYPSNNITKPEMAAFMSHLKAIDYWLKNSESEYAIIFEDDMDFELSKYWKFSWDEFLSSLTLEYDVLQLSVHFIDQDHTIKFHKKRSHEYSAAFYLIKRNYAQELIKKYITNKKYNFMYSDSECVTDHFGVFKEDLCYSMALLIPNEELGTDNSTIIKKNVAELQNEKQRLIEMKENKEIIKKLWENNTLTLNQLLGKKLI